MKELKSLLECLSNRGEWNYTPALEDFDKGWNACLVEVKKEIRERLKRGK